MILDDGLENLLLNTGMSDYDDLAPTELDTDSDAVLEDASNHSDARASPVLDEVCSDMYGFLEREETRSRSRSRSRNERNRSRSREKEQSRSHVAASCQSIAEEDVDTSTRSTVTVAGLEKQTVFYNCLPRNMEAQANNNPGRALYYQVMFTSLPKMKRIAMHLEEKYPGRQWYSYLQEVSEFGKYCNTASEMLSHMFSCGSSYKWGATADLPRRWYTLNLRKGYSHLYFVITGSVEDSTSMEDGFIAYSRSDSVPYFVRERCENRTNGGEGLGKDLDSRASSQGHFVYLAIAKGR